VVDLGVSFCGLEDVVLGSTCSSISHDTVVNGACCWYNGVCAKAAEVDGDCGGSGAVGQARIDSGGIGTSRHEGKSNGEGSKMWRDKYMEGTGC
jgi:hypothetical protein